MDEQIKKVNTLALDVLILSRNTLLVNLRFLDMAISRLKYHPIEDNTLLTDGEHLLYAPSGLSLQFAPAGSAAPRTAYGQCVPDKRHRLASSQPECG